MSFQLLSANLSQRDDESNAFCGYREKDVKLELKRASRLVSYTHYFRYFDSFVLIIMNLIFSRAIIASREGQVLDAVYDNVKNHSISPAVCEMVAHLNS